MSDSLADEYVLDPVKVDCGFWVCLPICGGVPGCGEVGIGKVYVPEGVVALDEEVHVDVGVVVERLVALQAWVSEGVQKDWELSMDSRQMRQRQLVLTFGALVGREG